jgi:aspartate racemase
MIGIIGGVGPYAGLHLHKCILDQTETTCDQEHLPVLHINHASEVPDRTEFLLGKIRENPAQNLIQQIELLYRSGARVIGIPCNTAHADPIYRDILNHSRNLQGLILINMIDELFQELVRKGIKKTGLLATLGSYRSRLFNGYAEKYDIEVVSPENDTQELIHDTIYNRLDGLKSTGLMNSRINKEYYSIIQSYREQDIQSIILGCTEISMAFPSVNGEKINTFKTIDILATALIREFQKQKKIQSK